MKNLINLFFALIIIMNVQAQNVGIGTTTPSAKLHIGGGTRWGVADTASIFLQSGTGGSGAARDWKIYVPMTAGNLAFRDMGFDNLNNGMTKDALVIQYNTGYVGIGTTNPGVALDVNGGVKATSLQLPSNAGANKILQSDGSGNATWVDPSGILGNTQHTIGEAYGGGIVFYVYDNGLHGLIAATADQSTGLPWYNGTNVATNAIRNDGILIGRLNTDSIISTQGVGSYAAAICAKYLGGGFGDWYLPSKYELNLLYLQRNTIGGFSTGSYWSSTEFNSIYAWYQLFSNGGYSTDFKSAVSYVRAIRSF